MVGNTDAGSSTSEDERKWKMYAELSFYGAHNHDEIKLSMDEIDGRRLVYGQESILHLSNHRSDLIAKNQELLAELVNILAWNSLLFMNKLNRILISVPKS